MATRMQNDDASQIHDMLLSAKRGEWDVVFDILEDKPYLVNCISSDRAWGVLHQAAWMNNFPVVQYLLRIPGCDPTIQTKQARKHGPGKSPRDLSTNRGIQCYLLEAERRFTCRTEMLFAPTCVFIDDEVNLTGSSIRLALYCFKNVLCSELDFDDTCTFTFIMKTIFQECLTNWVKVKNKICLALQVDDLQMSKFLKNGFKSGPRRKVDTMEQFFSRVINAFTTERNNIYRSLNSTLSLQGNPFHAPNSCDIAIAFYFLLSASYADPIERDSNELEGIE